MLNRTHTAVLERNIEIASEILTEPHEVAWVGQARWFVHVLEAAPDATISLHTEISPEGLTWCGHETSHDTYKGPGLISLPIENPGPYVRLRLKVEEPAERIKAIIYLTMRQ